MLSATGRAFPRDSFEYPTLNGDLKNGMPAFTALLDTSAVKELYLCSAFSVVGAHPVANRNIAPVPPPVPGETRLGLGASEVIGQIRSS